MSHQPTPQQLSHQLQLFQLPLSTKLQIDRQKSVVHCVMKNSTCYAGRGMELGGFFFIKHSMLGEIIFDLFKNVLSGRAQSPTQIFMSKLSDSLHARICMQFQLICCLSANLLKTYLQFYFS